MANTIVQNSWEVHFLSVGQPIPRFLGNAKFHDRVHNSSKQDPT
jgi:hypothetical protein